MLLNHLNTDRIRQILLAKSAAIPSNGLMYNPDFDITVDAAPVTLRPAAVLLVLCYDPTKLPLKGGSADLTNLQLLLTVRHPNLSQHAGQVALPGGTREAQDHSLLQTAIRETQEETGLAPHLLEHPRRLPDFIALSGFRITPFVTLAPLSDVRTLHPNPEEVSAIFSLPLSHCLEASSFKLTRTTYKNQARAFFTLAEEPYLVWGITAGIIHGFRQWLLHADQQLS